MFGSFQKKEKIRMEFTHDELYQFYNQVCIFEKQVIISFFRPKYLYQSSIADKIANWGNVRHRYS